MLSDVDQLYVCLDIVEIVAGAMPVTPDMRLTAPDLYLAVCLEAVVEGCSLTFLTSDTMKNRYPEFHSWKID